MMGFEIIGTGHYVPGTPVTNDDLTRVMDTSDEWIAKRSGIRQRHYAPEGVGASDLGTAGGADHHLEALVEPRVCVVLARNHQAASRSRRAPPHPATQLMKLREPVALRRDHHDYARFGHVDSDLDHSG